MTAIHAATRDFVCKGPETPLHEAARCLAETGSSSLLVTEGQRPVGILSERDLVRFLGEILSGNAAMIATVADLMTTPLLTVSPSTSIEDAAEMMQRRRIRSLPVVEGGEVVGILHFTDVLRTTVNELSRQRDHLEMEVRKRTEELQEAHDALVLLARRDQLMQIGNRRSMEQALEDAHVRAARYGNLYSVILLDVDHFKAYNDHHGHPAGDEVLRRVAEALQKALRQVDRAFRYGGEEILVLAPETDAEGAAVLARRLVECVADLGLPHALSPFGSVTISAGSSCVDLDQPGPTWNDVVQAADVALYEAKRSGRNRANPTLTATPGAPATETLADLTT